MRKQTVIDRIEIDRDGMVSVRLAREIVEDDGTVLSRDWHRTAFAPGEDVDAQMGAVNQHLSGMRYAPVDAAEIARIRVLTKPARDAQAIRGGR